MKTPITYWGGKQGLVTTILPLLPEHLTYVEPFFGGGAVFFAKEPSRIEVINDLNHFVVNFYRTCQTDFLALQERIHATPHSRACYKDALVMWQNPHLFTALDKAWAFYTLTNQGYSSKVGTWGYGTICPSNERRLKNKREAFTEDYRKRLDQVQIECSDALKLLKLRDRPTTFFYLDPPYHNADMGHYGGYTAQDFETLLQACSGLQGKFLLSSYPSDVLEEYRKANAWHQIRINQKLSAGKKDKRKVEVLTANYDIEQIQTKRT